MPLVGPQRQWCMINDVIWIGINWHSLTFLCHCLKASQRSVEEKLQIVESNWRIFSCHCCVITWIFFRECLRSSILKSSRACAQCCIGGWVSNHRASSNSSCPAFQQARGKPSEIVIGKMANPRIQERTPSRWGSVWSPEVGLNSILPCELMSDRGEGDMPKKWWRESSSGEPSRQWRSSRWWCSGPAAWASLPSPSSSSPATSWKSTTPL